MRESKLFHRIENIVADGERKGRPCEETTAAILRLFYDRTVPPEYLESCDCHDWTATIRDAAFQHKPACPKHDPRFELAILAEYKHQSAMQRLAEASDRDALADLYGPEAEERQRAIAQKLADVEGRDREN